MHGPHAVKVTTLEMKEPYWKNSHEREGEVHAVAGKENISNASRKRERKESLIGRISDDTVVLQSHARTNRKPLG